MTELLFRDRKRGSWNLQLCCIYRLCYNKWCPIQYHGRPCAAAPATGNKLQHLRELQDFIVSIFGELTEAEKEAIKKENEQSIAQAKSLAAQKSKELKEKSNKLNSESKNSPESKK